ncbi:MarR family winged helix-turn-helix transcriptional regulator [Cellulomonas taurus]|uniref:MarR family winged helix-turn-helix transcriptional regulator n=1 Tax=Cellulomonas taurus TaxID=2729175 RepID=UPI00145E2DD4|nr:MarR family transcriptional regulator [Cellulomonas taurus]
MTAVQGRTVADEDAAWRVFLGMSRDWFIVMERALGQDADASVADLELLEPLLDAGDFGLRAKDLAAAAEWQDSRVSHQLRRMEQRGLVARARDREDARGTVVRLTEAGIRSAELARATRRRVVRQIILDVLAPEQLDALIGSAALIRTAVADAQH